jgi:hypothetical protein
MDILYMVFIEIQPLTMKATAKGAISDPSRTAARRVVSPFIRGGLQSLTVGIVPDDELLKSRVLLSFPA